MSREDGLARYLNDRRIQINQTMALLKKELNEIDIAQSALTEAPTYSAGIRPGSIKDWAIRALAESPGGIGVAAIRQAIIGMGGPDIPLSSLSPQISRLTLAGRIVRYGHLWRLSGMPDV